MKLFIFRFQEKGMTLEHTEIYRYVVVCAKNLKAAKKTLEIQPTPTKVDVFNIKEGAQASLPGRIQ
jgi:hypothetical protein